MKRSFALLGFMACASFGFGQATISDGTSTFGWSSSTGLSGASVRTGTGGGGSAVFSVNGSADQMFQNWWWYRVNGVNTREFALSNQANAPVINGNNMTLSYREPEGFTSTLLYTITNTINGTALVTATNIIHNEGNNSLDMELFNYFDADMGGTAGVDSVAMLSGNPAFSMRITDGVAPINLEYRALDASGFQVGAFSSVRTLLTNAAVDNFNNSGLPFGPGDFTGGVQWHFNLTPGEQIVIQTSFEMNPVPEPATMAALALGVGVLLRRRRK